ncbi:MAG: hypothetical protein QXN96_02290 [Candidatus Bathyarchaeia archaeon]
MNVTKVWVPTKSKGFAITIVGIILVTLNIAVWYLKLYGFQDIGVLSIPIAILLLILGSVLAIYGVEFLI